MALSIDKYPEFKASLLALSRELVNHIKSSWKRDWAQYPPKIGFHYNFWDIKELPSYKTTIIELSKVPSINEKYSEDLLIKPVDAFLEIIINTLPNPLFVDKAFKYWWKQFLNFIDAKTVPIKLYIGLSNFDSDKAEYRLDNETKIFFYDKLSLAGALRNSIHVPLPNPFPSTGLPLHMIPGAIQVEFSCPADRNTLEYGKYSHECIDRMLLLVNALRLSTFGRLIVGPWIPICNPAFPVDGVRAISSPEDRERFNEPKFHLDGCSWLRFTRIYRHLKRLQEDDKNNLNDGSAIRRRFTSTISRFVDTFDKGYWESAVVDLVIIMESILTPDKRGGRMPLALAASNILGTNAEEAKEIFDNVSKMYNIRNSNVHGEPSTTETWEDCILEIAKIAGSTATNLDNGTREYAFEVMRDYARRSITAMLNLYYNVGKTPSDGLTSDLQRLHLDKELRKSILSKANCYHLSSRPKPP